jgi:hypothetical protein
MQSRIDRTLAWSILLLTLATYAYIFQGVGWNQMAHFGTIRSIVERGTADISPFADVTGDTMVLGSHQYSDKPPGLPLLGVPIYFALMHIERWFGIAFDAPAVWLKNLHALTILLCALPGAMLNVLIYFAFRREGATPRTAMLLSGGFAFGSLSLPYTGLFFSHVLCSLLVFAAWYKLSGQALTTAAALLAGMTIGYCNLCDLLTSIVTVCLGVYLIARTRDLRVCIAYAIGPVAALFILLIYDRIAHGGATAISAFHPTAFVNPHLFLGQFDWPDIRRIYWITYQPMRGLIACCPEFVICLFAPFFLRRNTMRIRPELLVILPILAGYLFFYMTYFGWTGGWSIGPRFLIPILPLLWMFALRPFQRLPIVCGLIIGLSVIYMLAITSVCAIDPSGYNNRPPTSSDPVESDLIVFLHGKVTDVPGSETLGALIGVPERYLIFPFLVPVVVFFGIALLIRASAAERFSNFGSITWPYLAKKR